MFKQALLETKADVEYAQAVASFDRLDFDAFLDHFFKAIHSRYDIEKPAAKRFIRKKLGVITALKRENERLAAELAAKQDYLKKLAAEYTLLGKECEREHMDAAAIANYRKALELYPDAFEARRSIERLAPA